MEFRSGMLGVVLIVLSLIASAILGVVLNVDRSTIIVEEPVYQSDITGLYNASTEKTYIENEPARNYNGYSHADTLTYPVDFKRSNTANNYPLSTEKEQGRTIDPFDLTATSVPWSVFSDEYATQVSYPLTSFAYSGIDGSLMGGSRPSSEYDDTFKLIRLSTVISQFYPTITQDLKKITLAIEVTKVPGTPDFYGHPDNTVAIAPLVKSYYSSSVTFLQPGLYTPYRAYDEMAYGTTKTIYTVEYEISTGLCKTYAGKIGDSTYYSTYYPADLYIYANSFIETGYQGEFQRVPAPNNNIKVGYVYEVDTEYIDPRYGVSNVEGDQNPVYWNNGYSNNRMDLTISMATHDYRPADDIDTITIDPNQYYNNQWDIYKTLTSTQILTDKLFSIRATQYPDGPLYISVVDTLDNESRVNLGSGWVGCNIRIDAESGKVSAQPIAPGEWSTFLNWTSAQRYIEIGAIPQSDFSGFVVSNPNMTIESGGNVDTINPYSFWFQVSKTYVFMNTYGVIMIDPHIDIHNWYPNDDKFMVSFFKTAATGGSIEIGGTEYIVTQNEITVPQQDIEVKIDITEYNLTYILLNTNDNVNTWEITIESPKSGTSATVQGTTTEVEMSGAWYFNSSYYRIDDVEKSIYEWKFGDLAFGINVMFLFMMGFLGIGTIVVWKLIPGILTAFDIGIVIIAEIILFFIAG